jgi:hypothetical protein
MSQELIEALYPSWDRATLTGAKAALIEKYSHLFDNISDDKAKLVVAQLCENQDRRAKGRLAEADGTTGDLPTSVFPNRFAFPVITQVFPKLVAMQLADVQPMNLPVGRIYYKNYIYSQTQQGATSGSLITHTGSYAQTAEGAAVPRARIQLTSKDVSVNSYKLNAQWSTEVAEDAMALGKINVESDLMGALAEEIAGELDYLVLSDMLANAGAGNVNYVSANQSANGYVETNTEAKHRLYESIVAADILVQLKRFHHTNYIIGHPSATQKIRNLDNFAIASGADQQISTGVRYFGNYARQWEVWEAPQFPNTNQLLLGTKGLGYVFSPYIPLELMNPWYDPSTDSYTRTMRTRCAFTNTIPNEFSTITLS